MHFLNNIPLKYRLLMILSNCIIGYNKYSIYLTTEMFIWYALKNVCQPTSFHFESMKNRNHPINTLAYFNIFLMGMQ